MTEMPDPTPAEPAREYPATPEIRAAIDGWFNTHIAGSPVARSVDAYNHLRSVLGQLGAEITAAVNKEI